MTEKAKDAKTQPYEVVRGYWPSESEKLEKGTVLELSAENAIDMIEAGIIRRVK